MGWFGRRKRPQTPEEMLAQRQPTTPPPPPGEFRLVVRKVMPLPRIADFVSAGAIGWAEGDLPQSAHVAIERGGMRVRVCQVVAIQHLDRGRQSRDVASHGEQVGLVLQDATPDVLLTGDVLVRVYPE